MSKAPSYFTFLTMNLENLIFIIMPIFQTRKLRLRDLPEISQRGSGLAGTWSHVCQTPPSHAAISVPFFKNILFGYIVLVATRGIFAVSLKIFHCSVQAPEHVDSVAVLGLSCPKSYGI